MVTLIKRLLPSLFPEPLAKCRQTQSVLNQLATQLDAMVERINRRQSDGIHEIVGFFQAVADVQDSFWIRSAINELKQQRRLDLADKLEALNRLITKTGRQPYGRNRTSIGQPITDADVYLGNCGEYFTKTVSFIKAHADDRKFYDAMDRQAREFMGTYIGQMLTIIHEFDRAMSA